MRYSQNDLITRNMLGAMRRAASGRLYEDNEEFHDYNKQIEDEDEETDEEEGGYEPITNDIKFGQNTLDTVKNDFVHSINSNVMFPKKCLRYSVEKRDVIFVGTILDLNNLHFKFKFNDNSGCGCYIWNHYAGNDSEEVVIAKDGESGRLQLTDENLKKVSLIAAAYKNWKDFWLENASLIFN